MRRVFIAACRELKAWFIAALQAMPGTIGLKLRARCYSRWLANAPKRLHVLNGVCVNGWKNISVGDDVIFDRACSLESLTGSIEIGSGTGCNYGVWIGADGGRIVIGSNVMIGPYVVMRAANHRRDSGTPYNEQGHEFGEIFVGDNVWIGAHVSLLSGTHIGNNSIIAAGAVVRDRIPENSLAAGVPAKIVRQLN